MGGGNAVKKILIIIGLMLGVGVLTGKTVKAAACKSYFTNIFGYTVREWCTPPADVGKRCDFNEKSCSKKSGSDESVYKFTCLGHSKRDGISECGNGMPGAKPNTGETMSVGDPGCGKTIQIDVYNKECMVEGKWTCDGRSVTDHGNMLDFFVYYNDDCPAPACNTESVKMEVSPNPVEADSPVSFIIGGDASQHIGDNYDGGARASGCSGLWYNKTCTSSKTAKTYTWTHTWKLCRADDPSNCSPKCENSEEYEVVSPRILSPKSCSISVGAMFSVGQTIAISADGFGNMGVGKSEPVRLWLERADGKAINPLPAGVGEAYVSQDTGNIAYRMGECLSTNDLSCTLSKNINGDLAPGAYFLHCDLPTDPPSPIKLGTGKCSGNPFCKLGLKAPLAAGDAKATVANRETKCNEWVYCDMGRQDRDYFTVAEPEPVGVGITIRNSGGTIVPVETGNKNQICQTIFKSAGVHDRKVKFSVTVSDVSGGETINKVSLRLTRGAAVKMQVNGIGLTTTTPTYTVTVGAGVSLYEPVAAPVVSGNRVTVTFPIQFRENFGTPFAVDNLQIWAEDETGQKLEWTDGGREFKVWDCKVPVSGSVFDGSDAPLGRPVCPTDGFSALVEADIFKSLTYVNPVSGSKIMTIMGASNYAGSGDKSLIWGGGDYAAKFNGEDGLPGSAPIARLGDKKKSPVPYTCPVTVAAISISQTEIDAYQGQPEATVDFSFTANQEPWYQTVSGGRLLGSGAIQSMVPPTCQLPLCTNALSMESDSGTNGVVIAGGGISNITGCSDCKNGIPNNWYRKNKNITDGSITYEGLKTLYYDRKGIGKVVDGGNWSLVKSEAGANKVIFVNSDLTINEDNTVLTGDFLMVVVKGNVTFNSNVKRFDGIIVTDKVIKAIGEDANTLDLNGSIYARGEFVNGRSLGGGDENNETPSVKVNYRPDFVFSMPAKLAENVYNWREGN